MTPEQIQVIQLTWEKVLPNAETAAALFYDRLFELNPELKTFFKNSDMDTQRGKLVQSLDRVVKGLDHFDDLRTELKMLGSRHVGYGVEDKYYATVGAALIWTLERGLAELWTAAVRNAWTAAYVAMSAEMLEGAAEARSLHLSAGGPGLVQRWQPAYNRFWI
jgi:nitric oxide dioxygenase